MSFKIVIVDYGMGNLSSVQNALAHLGHDPSISGDAGEIRRADLLILPGVGAFGQAMKNLRETGLAEALTEEVVEKKKPFLGICLGMQLIAKDSEELGFHEGLGWVEGHVRRIRSNGLRLPHIGWNDLQVREPSPLFEGIRKDMNFYFVHSFQMECDPKHILARTEYGMPITAAIRKGNIFATQFHPEKSHENGLALLKNFMAFASSC